MRHELLVRIKSRLDELAATNPAAGVDYFAKVVPTLTKTELAELDRWSKRREREEVAAGEEQFLEHAFPEDAPPELRRGLLAGAYEGLERAAARLAARMRGK